MRLALWLAALSLAAPRAPAPVALERARSTLSTACVFESVARIMEVRPRADIPLPRVRYESEVSIAEFQDAVEGQWGFRPDVVGNVYVVKNVEIFLIDEPGYYRRMRRHVEDSLAHELAHFVQVRYRGARLEDGDDGYESQAVSVQTQFREEFAAGRIACR